VVWEDYRNGSWDIYGCDLTAKEFQITADESDQWFPAIYQDIVVWEDYRNGNTDIYGYNISTRKEFQITTDQNYQGYPAIYKDIVVWQDNRNGNWDIYGYDFTAKEEFQITTDPRNQKYPAIYEYTVVWEDDRDDNQDIYRNIVVRPSYSDTNGDLLSILVNISSQMLLIVLIFELVATLILSVYFFRDFILRKFRASLAWGVGFIPYNWFVDNFLYSAILSTTTIAALGITSLYYGTSLLLFSKGSFFREKVSVLIMLIYSVFAFYFVTTDPYSRMRDITIVLPILKTPILLMIAILFYRIYRKIDSDDSSKRISLMATTAWFLLAISSVFMALWWGYYESFDLPSLVFPIVLIMSGLQPIAWILMVYSMVIRKAAMLIRKKRIAKDTVAKWTKKQEKKS
jgi:beta propeller repeat protein